MVTCPAYGSVTSTVLQHPDHVSDQLHTISLLACSIFIIHALILQGTEDPVEPIYEQTDLM